MSALVDAAGRPSVKPSFKPLVSSIAPVKWVTRWRTFSILEVCYASCRGGLIWPFSLGGFVDSDSIVDVAQGVEAALSSVPRDIELMSEPGRWFASGCLTVAAPVIAVRHRRGRQSVHLSEGAYGMFSSVVWDKQEITDMIPVGKENASPASELSDLWSVLFLFVPVALIPALMGAFLQGSVLRQHGLHRQGPYEPPAHGGGRLAHLPQHGRIHRSLSDRVQRFQEGEVGLR